jgi:hypothetical protein
MRLASHDNDSASVSIHALQQEKGEQPMAKIVRTERGVIAVRCPSLFSEVLESRIEDERSYRSLLVRNARVDLIGSLANVFKVR